MPKKYSQKLLIASLILNLNGCANIPDEPICAEISLSRGVCTYTVSGKTIIVDDDNFLDGKTWFDLRVKALTVPASTWAKFKAYLIKQCKKTNQCSADISQWDRDLGL
jgi:hypothetical protein